MAEYIERETALKTIDNYSKTVNTEGKVIVKAVRDIVDFICPTADVEEVRHGKWVFISGDLNYVDCKCSECNYVDTFVNDTDFFNNYCPDCGAKMDKE